MVGAAGLSQRVLGGTGLGGEVGAESFQGEWCLKRSGSQWQRQAGGDVSRGVGARSPSRYITCKRGDSASQEC